MSMTRSLKTNTCGKGVTIVVAEIFFLGDLGEEREVVGAIDVHCTGAVDPLTT